MNSLNRIKAKIKQIEKLLAQIKDELEILGKESQPRPKKINAEEPLPSEEFLRTEYEKLYEEFIVKNSKSVISEFIKGKNKRFLKAFCKANNLPLDTTKISKEKIAEEIMQWMVQRKAITKKVT